MTAGLKLALFGLHRGSSADPDTLIRRAERAEAIGLESFWIGDHVALPAGSDENPAEQPRLEAVVALAYMAAVTRRVRLAIGVIVLPQRQPVLLAKQLSTIDHLSKGRLIVGIGVGYLEPELRALGASLADRGARTDEYLAAMRALWAEPTPSFAGRFVSFTGVIERPRPIQQPHPPIVIGGHSAAALSRAVRSGNGWYGWELGLEETARLMGELREIAGRVERPAGLGELEITITPRGIPDVDTARQYAALGVHRLAVQPPTMDGTGIDELITTLGDTLAGRL
jgi:probable F420-dependent oxidoreductase